MKEEIIVVVVTGIIIIGLIIGVGWFIHSSSIKGCERKGELSGYTAEYRGGSCWVELCDDQWVRSYDLIYYMSICD
jgi:hypothetical protein